MTIGFFGKSPSRRENEALIDGLEISDAKPTIFFGRVKNKLALNLG
jgi:hypothetical protein